ncbi:hypothetical protein ACWKSJ_04655 [Staphylococcus equorum]
MSKKRMGKWIGVPVYTYFLTIGTQRTGQRFVNGNPRLITYAMLIKERLNTLTFVYLGYC